MKRVAIQGFSGCFHEQAARDFYRSGKNEDIAIVECATFDDLFSALAQGRADAAVMAIENTISGGLLPNFDLLRKNPQKIKGEVYLQIHQNLMALPGQKMEDIREVRTHYMAINQTRAFFERKCPWIKMVESEDTAKSAADIARERLEGVGAVASSLAAQEFGLEILASQIETYHDNFTRFLIVSDPRKADFLRSLEQSDKASLVFSLPHEEGSLSKVLTILSFYSINLTKIQSLPVIGHEWEYMFYVDVTYQNLTRYRQSIDAIIPLTKELKILGEYKECTKYLINS